MIAAAALVVFWPGLSGGFLFDDFPNLLRSSAWRLHFDDAAAWRALFSSDVSGAVGRPLSLASFALNHALSGANPYWLKFTNIVIHAFNGWLLWRIFSGLFVDLPDPGDRPAPWVAFALALAWVVHPVHASAVLYVIQRMEVAAATGVLLSIVCYRNARRAQRSGGTAWPWLLGWPASIALGLGFKESALVAPGFALAIELTVFRFSGPPRTATPWKIFWSVAVAAAAIGFALVTWRYADPAIWASRDFGMGERLLTEPRILALYLAQLLCPLPGTLAFFYDHIAPSRCLLHPVSTIAAAALVVTLAAAAVLTRVRSPLFALGIGWFLLAHALTATVVPLELAFEHRNYLALAGLLLALVPIAGAFSRRLTQRAAMAATFGAIALLSMLGAMQASTWGDSTRLALALARWNPDSPRALYGAGTKYLVGSRNDPASPQWAEARVRFERAAALPQATAQPLQALLVMDARSGGTGRPEHWTRLRSNLVERPLGSESVGALHTLSNCRGRGSCGALSDREVEATLRASIEKHDRNPTLRTLLAAFAWNRLQDRETAIDAQRQAVALSPGEILPRIGLAKFLVASGDPVQVAEGERIAEALAREDRSGRYRGPLSELASLRRSGR